MNYGLSDKTIETICGILEKYPQVEQAVIYGSRARGNYRPNSDIDLTLKGEELIPTVLRWVREDLDDSNLIYLFDVSIYDELESPELKDSIDRQGIIFYQKEK